MQRGTEIGLVMVEQGCQHQRDTEYVAHHYDKWPCMDCVLSQVFAAPRILVT